MNNGKKIIENLVPDGKVTEAIETLENQTTEVLENTKKANAELQSFYVRMVVEEKEGKIVNEVEKKRKSLENIKQNMAKAFRMSSEMDDELDARWHDMNKSQRKRFIIKPAPANADIDVQEELSNHFAQKLNIYKLLLICFIGSFVGVVIETVWCYITRGYIESRAGLVYGPFNLLYGIGAVALTVSLYKYRNRSGILAFIGGFVVGSILEYLCSWGQEMLIGSVSWDYSNYPFNLNGRICLQFSVMWGVLGYFWIKNIYPRFAKLILKINNKIGKVLTWVLTVFFVVDIVVSCIAVGRWAKRIEGVPAANSFWQFIDERFDDQRMKDIYANMDFGQADN